MIYKIRIILDANEDIFRDIEIEAHNSLEEFHNAIAQSFGFMGNEMASFYTCDDEWKQDMLRDIGIQRFSQEFGCKFLGSSDTLIDGDTLERIEYGDPVDSKWGGLLSIYEPPIENMLYVLFNFKLLI